MLAASPCPLPETAFLRQYEDRPGHYTDCFESEIEGPVDLASFISGFFQSPVMRLERFLIGLVLTKSNSADVRALAENRATQLSEWVTQERNENQLLLVVPSSGIRTWLMVEPKANGSRLLFGSALVPHKEGQDALTFSARALMGFHVLYSKLLLAEARRILRRQRKTGP